MSITPTIYLAFVDDWELRGTGAGDVRKLQFEPMRELVEIYNSFGVRGSFNAEVMQQINFRKNQSDHHELKSLADEWDDHVRETLRSGHDIQLHIHPQWNGAEYANGKWTLTSDWSILNYTREEAQAMLREGKTYLEDLLRPVDPSYRCVSFRSGSWCIAPSTFMLDLLVEFGIVFDMSIVGGVRYDTRNIKLDYTNCEEDFLPYYPVMTDARKVSKKIEPIICVPTNCFHTSRRHVLAKHLRKVPSKIKQLVAPAPADNGSNVGYGIEWAPVSDSTLQWVYRESIPYLKGRHLISDLAQLDYGLLKQMLDSIRKRAQRSSLENVPVILENHTKDVRDFTDIKRFIGEVSKAPDIKFLTLTELAGELKEGRFQIKTAK